MHSRRIMRLRGPAERGREHLKRLPAPQNAEQLAAEFSLTAPITFTVISTINPVTTTSNVLTIPTPTPSGTASFTTLSITFSSTTSQPTTTSSDPPVVTNTNTLGSGNTITPVVSVLSNTASSSSSSQSPSSRPASDTGAIGMRTLAPGAIVGIVIAAVLAVLALTVFLVRRRLQRARKERSSAWADNLGGGITINSFAAGKASTYPSGAGGREGGETSPGVAFASAQAQAMSQRVPLPVPAISYNNLDSPISPRTTTTALPMGGFVGSAGQAQATVKFTFIPSLPDELSIGNGERLGIVQEYDDGWALCVNSRGAQGMVPVECLERSSGGGARNSSGAGLGADLLGVNSRRASSLNAGTPAMTPLRR